MERVTALLDGFVSIIYANYYILMEIMEILFIFSTDYSLLNAFRCILYPIIHLFQINLQSST